MQAELARQPVTQRVDPAQSSLTTMPRDFGEIIYRQITPHGTGGQVLSFRYCNAAANSGSSLSPRGLDRSSFT